MAGPPRAIVTLTKILSAAVIALALAACDQGPMEKAGKAVDHAGEKRREKIKDLVK